MSEMILCLEITCFHLLSLTPFLFHSHTFSRSESQILPAQSCLADPPSQGECARVVDVIPNRYSILLDPRPTTSHGAETLTKLQRNYSVALRNEPLSVPLRPISRSLVIGRVMHIQSFFPEEALNQALSMETRLL